jgi:phage gpG-like protein
VVTHRLERSVTRTPAVVEGGTVSITIGSLVPYAYWHEFGITYNRTVKPGKVRLRTDRLGNLVRGRTGGAVFARNKHKLARTVPYEGGTTHKVTIPARHAFGFGITDETQVFKDQVALGIRDEWDGIFSGGAQ